MKILWIVNKPIGGLHVHLYGKPATGGLWMEAMIDRIKDDPEVSLAVVNVEKVKTTRFLEIDGIRYYTIPGLNNERYNYRSKKARRDWEFILSAEKPELLVLWGTEMPIAIPALTAAQATPAVVFVQGILESIGKYYTAGLTQEELGIAHSLRDLFMGSSIRKRQKDYFKRARLEAFTVSHCKSIIIENKWSEAYYKKICPDVKVHWCPLCISDSFISVQWSINNIKRHSIMCPAANYPIKGLHMLLKALSIVRKTYPDAVLNIPGTKLKEKLSFRDRLKQTGYERLIRKQIQSLRLSECIHYTGRLTAEEMAELMSHSHVFVMCSAIENHSSTLKEAMSVGVPSIASYVGGVPEYAKDGDNSLLYRFEDYEVLAQHIIRLFSDDTLCQFLSFNATQDMHNQEENSDVYMITKNIYDDLINNSNRTDE